MGDVKGSRVLVVCRKSFNTPSTLPFIPFTVLVITSSWSLHHSEEREQTGSKVVQVRRRIRRRRGRWSPRQCCCTIPAQSPCAPSTAAAPPIWKRGVKALFSRTPDPTTRLFTRQDWTTQEKLRESWIGSDWFQPNHFVVAPPAILEGSEHVNKGHWPLTLIGQTLVTQTWTNEVWSTTPPLTDTPTASWVAIAEGSVQPGGRTTKQEGRVS